MFLPPLTPGGGRVLIEFGSGGFTNNGSVDVSGGSGLGGVATDGGDGVFTSQPLATSAPERSSVVLLTLGGRPWWPADAGGAGPAVGP
jgi:hypothetical protein